MSLTCSFIEDLLADDTQSEPSSDQSSLTPMSTMLHDPCFVELVATRLELSPMLQVSSYHTRRKSESPTSSGGGSTRGSFTGESSPSVCGSDDARQLALLMPAYVRLSDGFQAQSTCIPPAGDRIAQPLPDGKFGRFSLEEMIETGTSGAK